mgnify:FL=1
MSTSTRAMLDRLLRYTSSKIDNRFQCGTSVAHSFSVNISSDKGILSSEIVSDVDLERSLEYYFNLMKNGKIIHRSGWSSTPTYSIELDSDGDYVIQGHIRYDEQNIWKKSETLVYKYVEPEKYSEKDFRVLLTNENSELSCEIVGKKHPNQQYCFYLLKYGVVLEKTPWQNSPSLKWNAMQLEPGTYVAQAFVRESGQRVNTFSNPIFIMNSAFEKSVERYFSETGNIDFEMPKVPESHYPFSKFLIHSTREKDIASELNFTPPSFHYTNFSNKGTGKHVHILHDSIIQNFENKKFIFSGTAKHGGQFIFGSEDIQNIDPHDLTDSIGNHSLVIINEDGGVEIHNDLFGIHHHYYFENEDEFLVTNNLFLLMDYASKNNLKMEIDWGQLATDFCFIHVQPFHQNFSSSMNIHGLKQQKANEFIVISDRITFNETKLDQLFNEIHAYKTEDYQNYIELAAAEIVENIQVVYDHPRFKDIMVDLSGGFDSRSVFAAITNISDTENKITLNCRHSELVPNDLIIASELNVGYQFPWNNSPRTKSWHPPSSIYGYQFGAYFSHRVSIGFRKYPKNHIRLNGMYGEVTARPYYPRKMIRENKSYATVAEFIEGYFQKVSPFALLSNGTFGLGGLKNIFAKELESNPGRSPLEKFDLHYLFFRAGLHCGDTWRNYIKGPEWGPLQSEKLFVAKYGSFEHHTLPKVQIDLIKQLNRDLLEIPFGDEQDNLDFSEIEKKELKSIIPVREATSNKDILKKWKKNEEDKKHNSEWVKYELSDWKSKEDLPLRPRYMMRWEGMRSLLQINQTPTRGYDPVYEEKINPAIIYEEKEMLSYLYHHSDPIFRKEVVIPLMTYIDSNKPERRNIQLKNKLISACSFIKFLKSSHLETE